MSNYMWGVGAESATKKRMLENGIPQKFISANLFRCTEPGVYEWKDGISITEEELDEIYRQVNDNENLHGSRERDAELFRLRYEFQEMKQGR